MFLILVLMQFNSAVQDHRLNKRIQYTLNNKVLG